MNTPHSIETTSRLSSVLPGKFSNDFEHTVQLNTSLSSDKPDGENSIAHRMALLNLGAALAVWKSFENKRVQSASQQYRSQVSASLRLSPNRTGSMPPGLLGHCMSSVR